jgi:hypothetical protein
MNKLEIVIKINEQIIWFGDKLEFGSCSKKIKLTELEHSILGSARLDYSLDSCTSIVYLLYISFLN